MAVCLDRQFAPNLPNDRDFVEDIENNSQPELTSVMEVMERLSPLRPQKAPGSNGPTEATVERNQFPGRPTQWLSQTLLLSMEVAHGDGDADSEGWKGPQTSKKSQANEPRVVQRCVRDHIQRLGFREGPRLSVGPVVPANKLLPSFWTPNRLSKVPGMRVSSTICEKYASVLLRPPDR